MLGERLELQIVGEDTDGLRALQRAEELQPDLILLDIGLPSLNGIEVARQILKRSPKSVICGEKKRVMNAMNPGAVFAADLNGNDRAVAVYDTDVRLFHRHVQPSKILHGQSPLPMPETILSVSEEGLPSITQC